MTSVATLERRRDPRPAPTSARDERAARGRPSCCRRRAGRAAGAGSPAARRRRAGRTPELVAESTSPAIFRGNALTASCATMPPMLWPSSTARARGDRVEQPLERSCEAGHVVRLDRGACRRSPARPRRPRGSRRRRATRAGRPSTPRPPPTPWSSTTAGVARRPAVVERGTRRAGRPRRQSRSGTFASADWIQGQRRPARAIAAQASSQQPALDDRLAVERDRAVAQRQVEVAERVPAGDLVRAGRVEEVAGERAQLGAVEVALVVEGHRVPARRRVHAPADVRDGVRLASPHAAK